MKVHSYARNINLNRKWVGGGGRGVEYVETQNFDFFVKKTVILFFLIPDVYSPFRWYNGLNVPSIFLLSI